MITTSHSKPFEYIEWAEEFSQKKRRRHELEQEKKRRAEQAMQRVQERINTGQHDPITATREAYSVDAALNQFGYMQKGKRWLSPNSGSKTPGVTVKNGKWFSHHDSDSMIGQPARGGGTWGDAFDLIVHYQYGGDFNATVKALGDQYTIQDPVKGDILSINKFNQRVYMRQKSTKKDFEEFSEKQAPKKPTGKFGLIRLSDVEIKKTDWLVSKIFERDSMIEIFGDPGCGKSFVGVDICCCIATGVNFHGHPVKQGSVIYIAGEGQNGLKRRFIAWGIRNQKSLDDAPIFLSTIAAQISDSAATDEIIKAIDNTGEKPALVVVDTLARNFGAGDENSTQEMNKFINELDRIRSLYKSGILIIHHTGHSEKNRARGAMALKGALDAEYRMTKDETQCRFECTKMKDFEKPEQLAFVIRSVDLGMVDDDGNSVTSAILDSTAYEPPKKKSNAGRGKNQILALTILDDLYEKHRITLSRSGYDPDGAKVKTEDWKDACQKQGMSRAAYCKVWQSLENKKLIKITGVYVEKA